MTLADLNGLDAQSAADILKPCCGSQRWAEGMSARRPFADIAELHSSANFVWETLNREDWWEAFASHPKIGETRDLSQWSNKEQEGMSVATSDVKARLNQLNREYQARFEFIFIICATGKSAEEMLASLERRLQNTSDCELQVAGQEQMKIVHLRLDKLIT